jgi:hypothetical protein
MMIVRTARGLGSAAVATLVAVMMVMAVAPTALSASAQRRTPGRPPLRSAVPQSIYGQAYQKGYDNGFAQGETDWNNGAPRDFQRSEAYEQRDRSYDPRLSSSEEYVQGYQLGFEMGYTDGYYGRAHNSAVPANGLILAKAAAIADAQRARERDTGEANRPREVGRPRSTGQVDIPPDTELRLKLTSPIETKNNRVGDRFTATVIMPAAYEGATIEGHIATLKRSGRVTGKTELALAFDQIILSDGRQGPLQADLQKILESETVKKVDEEGRVESGSRSRDSQVRGGVGAAAGAVIGGIAGGAKGAILGAILGGAAGVGTVYIEGDKDLILDPGTEMIIRTAGSQPR